MWIRTKWAIFQDTYYIAGFLLVFFKEISLPIRCSSQLQYQTSILIVIAQYLDKHKEENNVLFLLLKLIAQKHTSLECASCMTPIAGPDLYKLNLTMDPSEIYIKSCSVLPNNSYTVKTGNDRLIDNIHIHKKDDTISIMRLFSFGALNHMSPVLHILFH